MLNSCCFVVRPTADPVIKENIEKENSKIASFMGAVTKKYKREGEADADFFPFVAFGRQATYVEKYVKKGIKLIVRCRAANNNYEKDGKKIYSNRFVIEEVEVAMSSITISQNEGVNSEDESAFANISEKDLEDLPFE